MKWHSEITFYVFTDAWLTWNNYKIREKHFINLVAVGTYATMKINDFKKGDIDNVNPDLLKAKTAIQAYPQKDRPRDFEDISSIKWLQTTNESISSPWLTDFVRVQ